MDNVYFSVKHDGSVLSKVIADVHTAEQIQEYAEIKTIHPI